MKLIDAHIHLSDKEYARHVEELVTEAKDTGVVALVSNSMDFETSIGNLKLAEKYPSLVYPALGIHPWNVKVLKEGELDDTVNLIKKCSERKIVTAIGEIGLDYKYEAIWDSQLEIFDRMLHLGEEFNLPVIIHSRGTTDQIVDMLPSYRLKRVLLHWFSHPIGALYRAIEHGYFITEGPPVAYSQGIRDVVRRVPVTNLLTETDGPVIYRKPPYCGRTTSPSFLRTVIEAIAEIKCMKVPDTAQQIAENFETFFGFKLD
jgi:TatD DNase family protein